MDQDVLVHSGQTRMHLCTLVGSGFVHSAWTRMHLCTLISTYALLYIYLVSQGPLGSFRAISPITANIGWPMKYGRISDVGQRRLPMSYGRFSPSAGPSMM